MYKKVLVPLDGSPLAECTLSHVKNLVKDGSVGEVTLLNVVKVDLPWAAMEASQHQHERLDLRCDQEATVRCIKEVSCRYRIPPWFRGD